MNKAKEISALWSQIKPQIGELVRLCHEVESHAEVTADAYQRGYEEGYKDGYNEPGKGKIQVGDEVATDAGNRASVLYENPDGTQVFVFKSDGTAAWWTKNALHRTGRNFPEIATILENMRGETNE